MFPSMSSCASTKKKKHRCASTKKKNIGSVEKHGRGLNSVSVNIMLYMHFMYFRWSAWTILIFLVIASPQKLLGGFEWHLPIRLASVSSCASIKPNSGRSTNFIFLAPSSDLVKRSIRHLVIASPLEPLHGVDRNFPTLITLFHTCDRFVCLSHSNESVTRVKNSTYFSLVKKSNELFSSVTHMCKFFTRLKLDICEKLVPIKISELAVRIFHTYQNVTYSCE